MAWLVSSINKCVKWSFIQPLGPARSRHSATKHWQTITLALFNLSNDGSVNNPPSPIGQAERSEGGTDATFRDHQFNLIKESSCCLSWIFVFFRIGRRREAKTSQAASDGAQTKILAPCSDSSTWRMASHTHMLLPSKVLYGKQRRKT